MTVKYKTSMQSQSLLTRFSTRLGLVWLESRFGILLESQLGSFFISENESFVSASITKSIGSASFISIDVGDFPHYYVLHF